PRATHLPGKLPKEESLDAVWLGKQELSLQQAAWKMCLAPWDAISVWIMLDGNPGDLCCYTVPGSHLKGLEEHVPEPRSLDGHTIPGAQSTEHFPVSRGDVILTHALTIYGWRGHHPGQRTTSLRATFCAADASLSEASRAWLKEQGIISQGDY
ncbi:MAG: phytanoyl-CoA dioxygenase family protein, partial [Bacteroidota bacterium]